MIPVGGPSGPNRLQVAALAFAVAVFLVSWIHPLWPL